MLTALALLWIGLGLLMLAEARHSMALLIAAAIVTGAAQAVGYRGSLQIINEIAPEEQRAEVLSSYLLVNYVGNSLPVMVGLLPGHQRAECAWCIRCGAGGASHWCLRHRLALYPAQMRHEHCR